MGNWKPAVNGGPRRCAKSPVNGARRQFRSYAPPFLERLRDAQPNGQVHYPFWQRGGGYDRNIQEPATLRTMIDYIHNNPVRRGLMDHPTDWPWSSARFYAGEKDVPLVMDPLVEFVGLGQHAFAATIS